MTPAQPSPSLDAEEVEKFSRLAAEWWDPHGKFAVLHKFNPVRLAYIRDHVTARFARDPNGPRPLKGLRLLDIGCGGGLLSEPMARLGADVVAIDPSATNIATARVHANEAGLDIDYRADTAETLAAGGETFDVILNMEVIEHVVDPAAFVAVCGRLLKPGGIMVVATINRTLKSFAFAIVGAEYVLGWLPRGTHHWEKLIMPEELERWLAAAGLTQSDITGVFYNPLTDTWVRSRDTDVNYMIVADKPKP
ncbi:MAG TPA: bifunctional 2-polyprenyl-6-hydroxyphenol methylase/3-demethylubiquinol 3-O-methyltransferase UbiG [Aestuariivirgaceae bacterium]|nr:bifunctional 2-polyprenyl-6-hydroxyphenol methylase/3-demethylubiquinol 3-O-methyltransferase UbiG [Aestuariivirgaceae bacterium]